MYQADENKSFEDAHLIKSFELFELTIWLLEQRNKSMGNILQYVFCIKQTGFSLEEEAIKVDKLLHEQLQLFSYPFPLP